MKPIVFLAPLLITACQFTGDENQTLGGEKQKALWTPPGFHAPVTKRMQDYAKELVVRPLLLLIGSADDWTPPQYCREMAANVRARGADVTLVEYKGAYHYFDVAGRRKEVLMDIEQPYTPGRYGVTVAYDPEAAGDAQRQVEAFLARVLKGARPR